MKRLTDKKTAAALKSNTERLRAAGFEPSIMDQRYIKLAEYENAEEQREQKITKCSCWRKGHWFLKDHGTCLGTKEQKPCTCGGDKRKCDFYEHVRNEVK